MLEMGIECEHSWSVEYLPLKNWVNLEHNYFCAEFLEVRYCLLYFHGSNSMSRHPSGEALNSKSLNKNYLHYFFPNYLMINLKKVNCYWGCNLIYVGRRHYIC